MASITRESNGCRMIQFVGSDKRRRSIRLGKVSQRSVEAVKVKVEQLVFASISGHAPDEETARWVAGLDAKLHDKLSRVGLLAKRAQTHATLKAFLDGYVVGRSDVKVSTTTVYGHTRRNLVAFFGSEKPLRDITPGDADDWRIWLGKSEGLADNTVRRRSGIAKQFFWAAVRRKLISENPFADLVAAVRRNDKRHYFITRDEAAKVLDACPDAQWRLLFALSRYAGLRCPSEHLGLRWADVDWARDRFTVHSPKTEHHEGGESRQVPIFPELRPFLQEAFDLAELGAEYVITRYRDTNGNLRTQLERIVRRAGLEPWPKLFQNLRATRQTELADVWPAHVVCEWIGNSQAVAAKHYLRTTEAHFEEAAKAVQNPVQQAWARARKASQDESSTTERPVNYGLLRSAAGACDTLRAVPMGGTGLEPVTSTV
jgi:integrase